MFRAPVLGGWMRPDPVFAVPYDPELEYLDYLKAKRIAQLRHEEQRRQEQQWRREQQRRQQQQQWREHQQQLKRAYARSMAAQTSKAGKAQRMEQRMTPAHAAELVFAVLMGNHVRASQVLDRLAKLRSLQDRLNALKTEFAPKFDQGTATEKDALVFSEKLMALLLETDSISSLFIREHRRQFVQDINACLARVDEWRDSTSKGTDAMVAESQKVEDANMSMCSDADEGDVLNAQGFDSESVGQTQSTASSLEDMLAEWRGSSVPVRQPEEGHEQKSVPTSGLEFESPSLDQSLALWKQATESAHPEAQTQANEIIESNEEQAKQAADKSNQEIPVQEAEEASSSEESNARAASEEAKQEPLETPRAVSGVEAREHLIAAAGLASAKVAQSGKTAEDCKVKHKSPDAGDRESEIMQGRGVLHEHRPHPIDASRVSHAARPARFFRVEPQEKISCCPAVWTGRRETQQKALEEQQRLLEETLRKFHTPSLCGARILV